MSQEPEELDFDEEVVQEQTDSNADAQAVATPPLVSASDGDNKEASEEEILSQLNQIEALADIDPSVREMEGGRVRG
jgi:hypothetical protein